MAKQMMSILCKKRLTQQICRNVFWIDRASCGECPSCNCISTNPHIYSEDIRIGHAETVDKILKWLERDFL